MVSVNNLTGSTRILQLIFAAVHLALNGKLTQNSNGISGIVDNFNDLSNSTFSLEGAKTSHGLSLASSGFTLTSQPLLSLVRHFTTNVEHGVEDLQASRYGIGARQTSYLAGVSGSELSSVGLWFATFIYQTAKYGSWDCSDPSSLINQYELASNTTDADEALKNFLGVEDPSKLVGDAGDSLDNATSSSEVNGLLEQIWNLTSTPVSLSKLNSTGQLTQNQLLVRLSQDCYIKKTSIGFSFITFIFFLVSSGAVSFSFVQLLQKLKEGLPSEGDEESGAPDDGEGETPDQGDGETPAEGETPTEDQEKSKEKPANSASGHKKFKLGYSYANLFPKVEYHD
ncbi:hypothetical protein BN7_1016 [Wickerhamomyces ciferrii]|uniref:Uncharacterized protein n=1 Tax=Wickerhamomyces ciferrii (strain ATCC 14091 / BCRC 22168 / CBS 111 / JCM 3599 / NBRC 0793 / NRRL Y-1031 F-60-10) TaxID=1206466 RepID=K0K993_WICCF|nr:uncharacterized protein BN7_1016 [Wickerhamomyces ciferrii]CCH41475.1 hypothetical protein BN7_1016 [Wickerhamomyces ciferrii]